MIKRLSFCLLCLFLSACSFAPAAPTLAQPPTPTSVRVVIQSTPVPTISRQLQTLPTRSQTETPPTETPAPTPVCPPQGETRTAHDVAAVLDYREQEVGVQQMITFINQTGQSLEKLVLDVEPNRLAGVFTLDRLAVTGDAQAASYDLTGRKLQIELTAPLPANCRATIELAFQIRIPQVGLGDNGLIGYLGFSSRQINLGHWLPTMAAWIGDEWLLHEQPAVGEQTVAEQADWRVRLTVEGATDALQAAMPGEVENPEPGVWVMTHNASREIAISLSESFRVTSQQVGNTTVELYTLGDTTVEAPSGQLVDGAPHALEMAARSLELFSEMFGEYPYSRLVVVEGDFPDGMEFSGLVFVSNNWFAIYNGQPTTYLTIITVHEVSHQWWYARVGNDQATMPWLDEALATYSEYLFYERTFPELKDWWWEYRVGTFLPADFADAHVNSSVYEFTAVRPYINAVYLHGARMLHELRQDIGTDNFLDWLKRYAEAGGGRIANEDLFWSLLSTQMQDFTAETRSRFLR